MLRTGNLARERAVAPFHTSAGVPPRIKEHVEQLACLGGPPAFAEVLHVGRPNIGDPRRLLGRMKGILERRWLTNDGPLVREFEVRLREFLDVRQCVATCNATLGLELTVSACNLRGEVIVPAFTFVATAHALSRLGLTPVFSDVDPTTGGLDPDDVQRRITRRTTGILAVHLWGRACAVDALQAIADEHGLTMIFDAAHAFGCTFRGRRIGGFGRAEVFSFHATKVVNAFEGGAVATNDDSLAEMLRRMRNFGFAGEDHVVDFGTNAKMSEASAAMGLTSLESYDHFAAANRRNWLDYNRGLDGVPGIKLLPFVEGEGTNYHYVVLLVEEGADLTRDELQAVLRAENVRARRYFFPGCDLAEPYRRAVVTESLPVTRRLAAQVLCLPTGTALDGDDVAAVCAILRLALSDAPRVRAAAARH